MQLVFTCFTTHVQAAEKLINITEEICAKKCTSNFVRESAPMYFQCPRKNSPLFVMVIKLEKKNEEDFIDSTAVNKHYS